MHLVPHPTRRVVSKNLNIKLHRLATTIVLLTLSLVLLDVGSNDFTSLAQSPRSNYAPTTGSPATVYVESWRTGFSQIKPHKIFKRLHPRKPEYETLIRSENGKTAYKLSIWPGYVRGPGSGITGWTVELTRVGDDAGVNLLKPSNHAGQDYFDARDRIAWLYPLEDPKAKGAESAVIPFLAKRVIKIEGFYCIIQVKDYRFSEPTKDTLDTISVKIELKNDYSSDASLARLKGVADALRSSITNRPGTTAKTNSSGERQSATLTSSSGHVTLHGVPGPFRFESYCETNDGHRWTVGGLGEVLFLGVGPTRRYQLASRFPFNGDFKGVYFNHQGVGWVVGDRGVIFHTPNNGNTWIEQSVGGEETLYAVTCANNETCWAVGNNGLILRTTDAGKVWKKIETKNEEPLNAIDFIDTKTGWIATQYNGMVLHTTDGGLTWERQRVPVVCRRVPDVYRHPCDKWGEAIQAIRFVNDRVGWAASVNQIARTEDGGRTWKVTFAKDDDDSLLWILGLVAHDEKTVWAIDQHGKNLFSSDGGVRWIRMDNDEDARASVPPRR